MTKCSETIEAKWYHAPFGSPVEEKRKLLGRRLPCSYDASCEFEGRPVCKKHQNALIRRRMDQLMVRELIELNMLPHEHDEVMPTERQLQHASEAIAPFVRFRPRDREQWRREKEREESLDPEDLG